MSLINKLYEYPILKRTEVNGQRLYDTGSARVPSVTTILGRMKDMTGINKWRDRVGHEEAQRILTEAANLGTATHKHLENHVLGIERPQGTNLIRQIASKLADIVIDEGLVNINEVWGLEASLYSPDLYAGTTDCVGVYNGNEAIIDFKQSNKPKKRQWLGDYFLQLVAYAEAHNELHGSNINKGVVLMCTKDYKFQEFILEGDEFKQQKDLWWKRVETYYMDKY